MPKTKTIQEMANHAVWSEEENPNVPKSISGVGKPGVDWQKLFYEWIGSQKSKYAFLKMKGINPRSPHVQDQTRHWNNITKEEFIKNQPTKPKRFSEEDLWVMIKDWRKRQIKFDYETAEAVRTHIKLLMQHKLIVGNDEQGKQRYGTQLEARDIKDIAVALSTIQKVQRLALGMTTENLGLEGGSSPKGSEPKEETGPRFIVEVNESGKFTSHRPRQVN